MDTCALDFVAFLRTKCLCFSESTTINCENNNDIVVQGTRGNKLFAKEWQKEYVLLNVLGTRMNGYDDDRNLYGTNPDATS